MGEGKPTFRVIEGDQPSGVQEERIAISFVVFERKRLDVPVSALMRVEARATQTFADERGRPITFDLPHVEIWLTPNLQKRLRDFTRDLVGEVTEIHVGDKCISRPVVREPLGNEPRFLLSANDFAEAQALAATVRTGWRPMRVVE
jgi:preprotein translocase subunit SecD